MVGCRVLAFDNFRFGRDLRVSCVRLGQSTNPPSHGGGYEMQREGPRVVLRIPDDWRPFTVVHLLFIRVIRAIRGELVPCYGVPPSGFRPFIAFCTFPAGPR